MSTDLLRVENLRVEARVDLPGGPARQDVIVDDVSFTLRKGKVLGLIGESGAGKSTIGLAALAHGRGSVRITGGSARLGGVDILALAPRELRALRGTRIAYVAQSAASAFNPAKRLGDQMTEAAMVHGVMTQEEAETRARDLLGILGLPDPGSFGRRYPHQVSGGQLQRAMTAMALLPRPDLIVFDEPTTALDVTTQIEVLAAIRAAIAQTHTAAIYITHDLAVVAQIADDIMVLRGGRMVEYGPTRQIVDAPREDYTRRLLSVHRGAKDEKPDEGARVLSIEGVTASYGRTRVLDDVTLDLRKGRTLAIVGESGSGKSTLARVVTGLLRPDQGQVLLSHNPLSPTLKRRSRNELRQIQMIYQQADTAMNPRQTVGDIIGRPLTFYFGMRGRERTARIRELLDEIEMGIGYVDRYPAELSGGQKQRVAIARALAADPQIVLCDEPTSALDPLVAEGILNLLARLQVEKGVSYLFITHDIATVRAIADTVAVMHRGRILRFGPRERVFSPPYDDYTARLLASVPEMRVGWLDDILAERDASAVRS